jgi:hypothetical protein
LADELNLVFRSPVDCAERMTDVRALRFAEDCRSAGLTLKAG